MNDLEKYFRQHANELRFQKFNTDIGEIEIRGIGEKAIKYKKDGGEDEFAYIRNFSQTRINYDFYKIASHIIKSFDNELWNSKIRAKIKEQEKYCKNNKAPLCAPNDGFCTCGNQIYLRKDANDWISHCPECHYAYYD